MHLCKPSKMDSDKLIRRLSTLGLGLVSICQSGPIDGWTPQGEELRDRPCRKVLSNEALTKLDHSSSAGDLVELADLVDRNDAEAICSAVPKLETMEFTRMTEEQMNAEEEHQLAKAVLGRRHDLACWLVSLCRRFHVQPEKGTSVRLCHRPRLCDSPHFGYAPILSLISIVPRSRLLTPEGADLLLNTVARTGQPATILIGDSLGRHNVMAFERRAEPSALRVMLKRGTPFYTSLLEALARQPNAVQERIRMIRFQDVAENLVYKAQLKVTYDAFENDEYFEQRIMSIARYYADRRAGKKTITDETVRHCADFLLEEIPAYVAGFQTGGIHYRQVLYSLSYDRVDETAERHHGILHAFVLELQTDPRHADFRQQLIACGSSPTVNVPGEVLLPL